MKRILLFIPALLLLLASCSKPEHFSVIPANAPVVGIMNTPGIIKKVALNSLTNMSFAENWDLFKDSSKATTKAGKLMRNLSVAGLNVQEEIYAWVAFSGVKPYYSTCFALEKQAELEKFVKDSLKSSIETVGQFQTAVLDSTTLLAWNKSAALILYSDESFGVDSLKISLKSLPDGEKNKDHIGTVDEFKALRDGGHDVSVWVRSELYKNNLPSYLGVLGYINGTMYADFNNGQIEFSFEQNVKDKDLQAYTGSLNTSNGLNDFSVFSKDKLLGAVAGSVNFTSAYMMKNKDSLNKELATYNVSADDVYKSFTGDFAVGVQGVLKTSRVTKVYDLDDNFELIEKMDTVEETTPLVTAIFKLRDEKGAGAILDKIAEKLGFLLTAGHYTMKMPGSGETMTHVYIKNGNLVISNDQNVFDGKGGEALTKEQKAALQQPLSVYLNYQLLHKADLGKSNPFTSDDTKAFISQMDFMSIAVKEEKANVYRFTLDLSLLNKDENALIQLMKFRRNSKKDSSAVQQANV